MDIYGSIKFLVRVALSLFDGLLQRILAVVLNSRDLHTPDWGSMLHPLSLLLTVKQAGDDELLIK